MVTIRVETAAKVRVCEIRQRERRRLIMGVDGETNKR